METQVSRVIWHNCTHKPTTKQLINTPQTPICFAHLHAAEVADGLDGTAEAAAPHFQIRYILPVARSIWFQQESNNRVEREEGGGQQHSG